MSPEGFVGQCGGLTFKVVFDKAEPSPEEQFQAAQDIMEEHAPALERLASGAV